MTPADIRKLADQLDNTQYIVAANRSAYAAKALRALADVEEGARRSLTHGPDIFLINALARVEALKL